MLLKDKIAVITGASRERGIGKATAKVFEEHGARVVILDLDENEAAKAAADIGSGHIGLRCDVTSMRSEEHTSELQSLMRISYDVICLKKKKKKKKDKDIYTTHRSRR